MDTITRSILINRLEAATEEMAEYLVRAAFSINIKNRRDVSCAIYDVGGDLIAQGMFIPVHLGVMSSTVKELLKVYPAETMEDGDIYIHNDTYMMGSHLFDVCIFKPIFYEGKLFALCGCIAHQVDIGGSPTGISDGTIYQEGLRITGLKLYRNGVLQEDIMRLICANVRAPFVVRGDLMAQVAAMHRGEMRLRELARKYGLSNLTGYFDEIKKYGEDSMRRALELLPDGESEFDEIIETNDKNRPDVPIHARVTKRGGEIEIDFNGSGAPCSANVNAPFSVTLASVYYSVRSLVGDSVYLNSGAYRAIKIVPFKTVTILNAQPPSPAGACTTIPSQRAIDLLFGCFAQLYPEKVSACDGQWDGVGFTGKRSSDGTLFAYTETYGAGRGAMCDMDGASGHQTHASNTANASTEMIELEQPFIVEAYRLTPNSAGAGTYRGGLSIERQMRCLEETYVTALISRNRTAPYGLSGGMSGCHDEAIATFPDGTSRPVRGEKVPAGTVLTFHTSGGGGWGDPKKRDRRLVEADIANGYISEEEAKTVYGY